MQFATTVGVAVGGLAWCAGWYVFWLALSRVVLEFRTELREERAFRERMFESHRRAQENQREDALRTLTHLADRIERLAQRLEPRPEST